MPPNLPSYLENDAFIGRCHPAAGGSLFVRLIGLRSQQSCKKNDDEYGKRSNRAPWPFC